MSSPRGHPLTTCSSDSVHKSCPMSSTRLFNHSSASILHVTHKNNNMNHYHNNNNNNYNNNVSKGNHCSRIPVEEDVSSFDSSLSMLSSDQHERSASIPSNSKCSSRSSGTQGSNYYSTLQLKARKVDNDGTCKYKSTSTLPRQLNKNNLKSSKLSTSSPLLPLSAPFEVVLKKKDGTLGFTICKKDDGMFYIKSVINEPAINEPAISPGDKILRVNGIDVSSLSHTSAISFLRSLPDIVTLKLEPVIPEDVSLDMEQFNFYSTSRLNKLLDTHDALHAMDARSSQHNGYTSTVDTVKSSRQPCNTSQQQSQPKIKYSNQTNATVNSEPMSSVYNGDSMDTFFNSTITHGNGVLDDEPAYHSLQHDHLDSSGSSSSLSDIFYTEEDLQSSKSQKNHSTSSLKKQLRPEALKMISEKGNTDSLSRLRLRKQKSKNRLQCESNTSLPPSSPLQSDTSITRQVSSNGSQRLSSTHQDAQSMVVKKQSNCAERNNQTDAIDEEKKNIISPEDVMLLLPPEQFSDTHIHSSSDTMYGKENAFTREACGTMNTSTTGAQDIHESSDFTGTVQATHSTGGVAHPLGKNTHIPGQHDVLKDNGHRSEAVSEADSVSMRNCPNNDTAVSGMFKKHRADKCFNFSSPAHGARSAKDSDVASTSVKSGESTTVDEEAVKLHESTSVTTAQVKRSPICVSKKLLDPPNGASRLSPGSLDAVADDANNTSIDLLLSSASPQCSAENTAVTSTKFAHSSLGATVTTVSSAVSSSSKFTTAVSTTAAPSTVTTCSSSTSSSTSSSFAGDDAIPSLAKWRGANLVDHLYLAAIRDEQDSGFGDSVTPRHTLDKPLQLSRLINERLDEQQLPTDGHHLNGEQDTHQSHQLANVHTSNQSNDSPSIAVHSTVTSCASASYSVNHCTTSIPTINESSITDCGSKVPAFSCITEKHSLKSLDSSKAHPTSHSSRVSPCTESNNNQMTRPLEWSVTKNNDSDIVIPTITEVTVDVCLEKGWSTRLGIQLEDDALNRLPRLTVVKCIVPNTIASADGTIKRGWRLQSVNDIPLEEKSVKQVVEFLRKIKGRLNFRFLAPVDINSNE